MLFTWGLLCLPPGVDLKTLSTSKTNWRLDLLVGEAKTYLGLVVVRLSNLLPKHSPLIPSPPLMYPQWCVTSWMQYND
jgi:hypothetical protein